MNILLAMEGDAAGFGGVGSPPASAANTSTGLRVRAWSGWQRSTALWRAGADAR